MDKKDPKTLTFRYIRTPSYRTYNVDGVFGGLNPKNNIFIEFFSEKLATPNVTKHEVLENGLVGKIIDRDETEGIIREIECGVYLDIQTAMALSDWLNERIQQYKDLTDSNLKGGESSDD